MKKSFKQFAMILTTLVMLFSLTGSVNGEVINSSQNPVGYAAKGHGVTCTPLFPLGFQGLMEFRYRHYGKSNFIVYLLDQEGNKIKLLANELGNCKGSKAIRMDNPGNYLLNIDADGRWTVLLKYVQSPKK